MEQIESIYEKNPRKKRIENEKQKSKTCTIANNNIKEKNCKMRN